MLKKEIFTVLIPVITIFIFVWWLIYFLIINSSDSLQNISNNDNIKMENIYGSNRLQTSDYKIKFFIDPLEGCEYIVLIGEKSIDIIPRMLASGKQACARN